MYKALYLCFYELPLNPGHQTSNLARGLLSRISPYWNPKNQLVNLRRKLVSLSVFMKGQDFLSLGVESSNDHNGKTYRDEKSSPAAEPSANSQGLSVAFVSS